MFKPEQYATVARVCALLAIAVLIVSRVFFDPQPEKQNLAELQAEASRIEQHNASLGETMVALSSPNERKDPKTAFSAITASSSFPDPRGTPNLLPDPPLSKRLEQFAQERLLALQSERELTKASIADLQPRIQYLGAISIAMNSIGALATLMSCYFCWLTYRIRKKFAVVADPEYN